MFVTKTLFASWGGKIYFIFIIIINIISLFSVISFFFCLDKMFHANDTQLFKMSERLIEIDEKYCEWAKNATEPEDGEWDYFLKRLSNL